MRRRLIHYSSRPLTAVEDTQPHYPPREYTKPRGLWISVKGRDDWPSWCRRERFELHRLVMATQVHLVPSANILWVRGLAAFDAFSESYRNSGFCGIDWPSVAQRYDGIVIAPYLWERRLGVTSSWYYGWDCASGCIWRSSAVARLEPVDGAAIPHRSAPAEDA